MHELRWFPPESSTDDLEAATAGGATVDVLERRGAHLGFLSETGRPEQPEELAELWNAARPIHLPGVLVGGLEVFEREIESSHRMMGRLASGTRFLDLLSPRLVDQDIFVPAGSTFDRDDEREIEKVWVDGTVDNEVVAPDLWAKLSWIAADERDASLRIRFSHGVEQLAEWIQQPELAPWADALADQVFPECATISGHLPLLDALSELVGVSVRLSERIVYANAPGGGAAFHSDADPGQRGVVFGQFRGRTAWFALPKSDLSESVADIMGRDVESVTRALGADDVESDRDDIDLYRVLNRDPRLASISSNEAMRSSSSLGTRCCSRHTMPSGFAGTRSSRWVLSRTSPIATDSSRRESRSGASRRGVEKCDRSSELSRLGRTHWLPACPGVGIALFCIGAPSRGTLGGVGNP